MMILKILTTCAVCLVFTATIHAGPEIKGLSKNTFEHSHSDWSKILQDFVVEDADQTRVRYSALKQNSQLFNSYLNSLSKVSLGEYIYFTKDQKLAFLINAYNAFTIKLIIDHYPVKSIKKIGGLFSNPWNKKFFTLLGQKTHLDAIEHEMIRKVFNEPRIHFALVCASMGCPSLRTRAFVADKLEVQLDEVARGFLKNPKRTYFDEAKNTLYLSSIFKWYGDDFKVFGSVKNFVAPIIAISEAQKQVILGESVQISYLDYDWSLNDTK